MHLSTSGIFLFATSALALPEPIQGNPNGPLEARDNPLVDHWEYVYKGAASSLSPLTSLALLTIAAMTIPLTTALTLSLSPLSLTSASPVANLQPAPDSSKDPLTEKIYEQLTASNWESKHKGAIENRQGFEGTQLNSIGAANAGHMPGSNGGAIGFGPIARDEDDGVERRGFPGFEGTQINNIETDESAIIQAFARSEDEVEKRQGTYTFPGFEGTQISFASSDSFSRHVLAACLLAGVAGMLFM
jgi:hypothetical protein